MSEHPTTGQQQESPPADPPHAAYHWNGADRRYFEGWWVRLIVPELGGSFAWVHHVEDPAGTSQWSKAATQVVAPGNKYLMQYTHDVSHFWASNKRLHAAADYGPPLPPGSPGAGNCVAPSLDDFEDVRCGFLLTNSLHQGCVQATSPPCLDGYSGEDNSARCVSWSYSMKPMYGWGDVAGARGNKATMGALLAELPQLGTLWQMVMAHGWASGWVELDGQRHQFTHAPAYIEKNWGNGFPLKYFWLQCNAFRDHPELTVTIAGARLQPLGLMEDAGMAGVHWGDTFVEVMPWNGELSWKVSPWGTWRVTGSADGYELLCECETSQDDGVVLRAPDKHKGMVPLVREGSRGHMRLRLWRVEQGWVGSTLTAVGAKDPDEQPRELLVDAWSDYGACEVGGGPWDGNWESSSTLTGTLANVVKQPLAGGEAEASPGEPYGEECR